MKIFKATVVALIIALTIFFAVTFYTQNMGEVTISYRGMIDSFTAPFATIFLFTAFCGMLIGIIVGIVGVGLSNVRLRLQLRREAREAEELRKELEKIKGEDISEPKISPLPPARK